MEKAFDWGAAILTLPGESKCGDRYLVKHYADGALVAMIDALGHGPEAADAAQVAADVLSKRPRETPAKLIEQCHASMRGTRGAAIGIASFDWRQRTLTWLGIGNISAALINTDLQGISKVQELLRRSGVVGDQLPELNLMVHAIEPGDTLILTTDGVHDHFTEILPLALEPQPLAENILQTYAKHNDDAAVLVFRCNRDL